MIDDTKQSKQSKQSNPPQEESQRIYIPIGIRQILKWFSLMVTTLMALLAFTASYILHNVDSSIAAAVRDAGDATKLANTNTGNISALTTIISVIIKDDEERAREIDILKKGVEKIIVTIEQHSTSSEATHDGCHKRITILEGNVKHLDYIIDTLLPRRVE